MSPKTINFELKQKIICLSGACFWFRKSFFDFLKSCGVSGEILKQFPKEGIKKYDVMRNLLNHFEKKGDYSIINNIVSGFYNLTGAVDKDNLDQKKAKELLNDFRKMIGNDPIENEIKKKEMEKAMEEGKKNMEAIQNRNSEMSKLNIRFKELLSDSDTPQQKGFELEKIFVELLRINELKYTGPYKIDGEQIDGYVNFEKFDYLIECKFEKDQVDKNSVAEFDNKLKSKAQSTRGIFLSYSGFNEYAIKNFSGNSPRILFIDGQELSVILEGYFDLIDALNKKIDALVRKGDIYHRIC